ncbi:HAD-IB family hydrolase [Williamsia sp.]|uniref:HAD family hydrolase n=1 Tax=Williamsia sp. TaxID=1872085 RepID=UPI001A352D44|nr:HAD-IB family hydrolase [Williamsia sp.]MBJ7289697.1 HAD-IB family hydrolase [Williamsia sp.]
MTTPPRGIAFFDVDETLITTKSMFRFLEFFMAAVGRPPAVYAAAIRRLTDAAHRGVPRRETNALFYENLAGWNRQDIADIGQAWFNAEMRLGHLFHPPVAQRLAVHQAQGTPTVLVSGSFSACLDPIGRHVGADEWFGTVPTVDDDRYTGAVSSVVIGPDKGRIARRLIASRDVAAEHCWAYGDHASDIDLLRSVGRPFVVGSDPALHTAARIGGWQALDGISTARPALVPATQIAGPAASI